MTKIITKSIIAAFTLVAMTGTAYAAPSDIPDWTTIPGAAPVTPVNILTTGGHFKYKKGSKGSVKMSYKSKGSKSVVTLNDVPSLGSSLVISGGKVSVKKGRIKITGRDPLNLNSTKKITLVRADYDESAFAWEFNSAQVGGFDLFGVTTTNLKCPVWSFCTGGESFYVAGDFGSDPDNIKLKDATSVTTIPVPAAVWLFGSGLLGLVGVARRKKAS